MSNNPFKPAMAERVIEDLRTMLKSQSDADAQAEYIQLMACALISNIRATHGDQYAAGFLASALVDLGKTAEVYHLPTQH